MPTPLLLAFLAVVPTVSVQDTAPATVLAQADSIVKAALGDSVFATAVRPRPDWTERHEPTAHCGRQCAWPWQYHYWVLLYDFVPTNDSARVGQIVVPLDTAGRPLPGYPMQGAPPCASRPSACRFGISADSAMALARARGLPCNGATRCAARFAWSRDNGVNCNPYHCSRFWAVLGSPPTYTWHVTFSTGGSTGITAYFDATTGAFLSLSHWVT